MAERDEYRRTGFFSRPAIGTGKPRVNTRARAKARPENPTHEGIPGFTGTGKKAPADRETPQTQNRAVTSRRPSQYGSGGGLLPFGGVGIGTFGGASLASRMSANNAGLGNGVQQSAGRDRGPSLLESQFGRQLGQPASRSVPRSLSVAAMPPATLPPDNSQYTKTLNDFLEQARQVLAGGQESALSGIASQEGALRGNAQQAQGTIGQGYKALSAFIGGQADPIKDAFQGGIDQTTAIAGNTQQSIQEGAAAAQAQQQAILARLGIQDANIPIANTGQSIEAGTAQAVADSAQRAQLTQNQMASNQQTELGYNTAAGSAAQLEGQGQQNRITQDLTSRLADLQGQRSQIQGSTEMDAYALAQQLMDQDYQMFQGNYDRRYQTESDAMQFAQQQAEMAAKSNRPAEQAPLNSTGYRALGPAGQANYALQQSGVDPGQAAIITRAIEQAYATGEIRDAASFARVVREAGGVNPANQIDASNAAMIYYQYFQ